MTAFLEVRGLSKRFGGVAAVEALDFQLQRGAVKAVIGPNGAGKTTLFNMLSGVLPPSTGEILLEGRRIDALPSHRRARAGLGRTFQNLQIFRGMSVLENVMVGRHVRSSTGLVGALLRLPSGRREERAIRDAAAAALDRVGLVGKAQDAATALSFGELKLLELARALAGEPTLLLLDEPAAGVSAADLGRLAAVIRQVNEDGVTVLLVEHNMRFVMSLSHDVLVLNFGRKIAEGAPAAIRADPRVIEAYLGEEAADA